jgi:hypothetical protein
MEISPIRWKTDCIDLQGAVPDRAAFCEVSNRAAETLHPSNVAFTDTVYSSKLRSI